MSEEFQHTPFVEGGVYEKSMGGEVLRGMITCSVKKANGIKVGTMVAQGFVSEKVIEGTESLDQWKLVHVEPVVGTSQLLSLVMELKERVDQLAPPKKK